MRWGAGAGRRARGARGMRGHRSQPGPVLATGGHCSKMASQPPRPSSSPKYLGKDGKTSFPRYRVKVGKRAPRKSGVPPSSVPAADGAPGRTRLSWAILVKAIVCFKRVASEVRRGHMLRTLNPLSMEQKLPENRPVTPEKTIWGDQEPLSKVRAALGGGGGSEHSASISPGFSRAPREGSSAPSPLLEAHPGDEGLDVAAGSGLPTGSRWGNRIVLGKGWVVGTVF